MDSRNFHETCSSCRPKAGEPVRIYHAGWGTTYVVYTDANGYYSLTKPKPPGSTPIYVRWTDPDGVEHECTTSACFSSGTGGCPPGQKQCPDGSCVPLDGCCSDADCPNGSCVNGVCVPGTCTSNSDCPPGYHCDNGVCVPDTCTSDADCPPGYVCVNGTCVSGNKPVVVNADALDLSAFCSSGIKVPGTVRVVDSDGTGIRALLKIIVNGTVVDCVLTDYRGYVNGGRDYFVDISKYRSVIKQGVNTISLQAVWCASGSCVSACPNCSTTDCSPGIVSDPASKRTPCGCNYSLSCSVSATQVQSGTDITVSGRLTTNNPSLCSVANQPVSIYVDGLKMRTVYTDTNGNFTTSLTLTCASSTTKTIEVRALGASCSKQVSCNPAQKQYAVGVSYVDTFFENEFVVYVYDPTKQSTDYKPSDLKYTYIPTSTIAYVYYRGKTWHTITDRFSVAPAWTTNPNNITCYLVQEFCSTVWTLKNDVKAWLDQALYNAGITDNTIRSTIVSKADYPAAEVYKKWFYEEKVPPECNSVTPNCSDSTALYQEEGTIFKTKKFLKVVTFTVY